MILRKISEPLVIPLKVMVRWIFKHLFRIEVHGLEHYHAAGKRVLIVANHVSLLDGVLFYLFLPERPTFAINTHIAKLWYFQPLLMFVDLFRMDTENPLSTKALIRFLGDDNKAVIFPEGRCSKTGTLMKIYDGPALVADKSDATLLPIGIHGAEFSKMSSLKGMIRQVWFPRITLTIRPPTHLNLDPKLDGKKRRAAARRALSDIMDELMLESWGYRTTLYTALLNAQERHGASRLIADDINRKPMTYRQLITRTFILAQAIEAETQQGERVGVLLPNTTANLVVFFALHCGARIPAMLNYTAGSRSLVTACHTASVRVVYTSRAFMEKANLHSDIDALEKKVKVIFLEDLRTQITWRDKLQGLARSFYPRRHYQTLSPKPNPDDWAVVLFTSGSEGKPKGVVLSHSNLLANRAQAKTRFDLTHGDTVFNCLPMFHSFGLTAGTLLPLLDGAKTFFYPSPLHYHTIPELCYDLSTTVLFSTSTFLCGWAKHAHPYDFHRLRYVIAGAEKLREETRQVWSEKFGIRILEGYGATETSPIVSVNTPKENKNGSVGRLLPGMDYYLHTVEGINEGGRLVVAGPNIMLGYLLADKPERLVPPPAERGTGWYDTGDIVSVDEEGYITITGRAKRFAKIAGEMVSLTLAEELACKAWPESQHAAVVIPDRKKGEAIVLVTDHKTPQRQSLISTMQQDGISELAVPSRILEVPELPVLGTGKIDYVAIKEWVIRELM